MHKTGYGRRGAEFLSFNFIPRCTTLQGPGHVQLSQPPKILFFFLSESFITYNTWLIKSLSTGDQLSLQSFSLSWRLGGRAKKPQFPNCNLDFTMIHVILKLPRGCQTPFNSAYNRHSSLWRFQ